MGNPTVMVATIAIHWTAAAISAMCVFGVVVEETQSPATELAPLGDDASAADAESEYFVTAKSRSQREGGADGRDGRFSLTFYGSSSRTKPITFTFGPGQGDIVVRKKLKGIDVGDI